MQSFEQDKQAAIDAELESKKPAPREGECSACKWINGHRSWCPNFTLMSEDGRTAFLVALRDFTNAGHRLVELWADADEVAPLPARLRPPLSLDEWLMELSAHYAVCLAQTITAPDNDEITEWEQDGDPCNHCGMAANYDPANGWYYHVDPNVPGCFLMGSGPFEDGENDRIDWTPNTQRGPLRPSNEQESWRASAALAAKERSEMAAIETAPNFDQVEAAGLDGTLRSHGGVPYTWAEVDAAKTALMESHPSLEAAEVAAGQPYLTDPDAAWKEAEAHMDALDLEIDDPRMGTRYIDLGAKVFGLLSWDGEYLIGLYFRTEDGDDGGVCARFDDWASTIAFLLRLIATQG